MQDYPNLTDLELLDLLKESNRTAFSTIYSKYWEKLHYLAVCKISDTEEAENIVRDVFVSLWERRNEIQLTDALDGYLVVAVKYKVLTYLARKQKYEAIKDELKIKVSIADRSTTELLAFEDLKA